MSASAEPSSPSSPLALLPPALPVLSQRGFSLSGGPAWQTTVPGWACALICHIRPTSGHLAGTPAPSPLGVRAKVRDGRMKSNGDFREKRCSFTQVPNSPSVRGVLACFAAGDLYVNTNEQGDHVQHPNGLARRTCSPCQCTGFQEPGLSSWVHHSCLRSVCVPLDIGAQCSANTDAFLRMGPYASFPWMSVLMRRPGSHSRRHMHTLAGLHPAFSLPSWDFHYFPYISRRHGFVGPVEGAGWGGWGS